MTSPIPSSPPSSSTGPAAPTLLLPPNISAPPGWALLPRERLSLKGYQVWAVLDWICERRLCDGVVMVLTGDERDEIMLDRYGMTEAVVRPEEDESEGGMTIAQTALWKSTIGLLKTNGARLNEVQPSFHLPVHRGSQIPANSKIVIPGGDWSSWRDRVYVRVGLGRLGVLGRGGGAAGEGVVGKSQQTAFQSLFHLPTTNSDEEFQSQVVQLIKLVQDGLSLFGLGCVKVPGAQLERDEAREKVLDRGDGLLCNQTLSALSLFQLDIAEPFLHLPPDSASSTSTLTPTLLASLLSTLLTTKSKLAHLHLPHIPKDIFKSREKFLNGIKQFQKENRFGAVSPVLTLPVLTGLERIWERNKRSGAVSIGIGSAIGGLREGFEGIREKGRSLVGAGTGSGGGGGELGETTELRILVDMMVKEGVLVVGNTIGRVWGIKGASLKTTKDGSLALGPSTTPHSHHYSHSHPRSRTHSRSQSLERHDTIHSHSQSHPRTKLVKRHPATNATSTEDSGGEDGTEGEMRGGIGSIGRGVLKGVKGVKEKAGKVGRKVQDGLGFAEHQLHLHPHPQSQVYGAHWSKESLPDDASIRGKEKEKEKERGSMDDASTISTSKRRLLASRIAAALSTSSPNLHTSMEESVTPLMTPFTESPPVASRKSTTERSNSLVVGLGLGAAPIMEMKRSGSGSKARRTVSEAPGSGIGIGIDEVLEAGGEERRILIAKQGEGRRRRHSVNIVRDAPRPWVWLSRQRLVMDVHLRSAAWEAKQKERKLEEMASALQTIYTSYVSAIASLQPHLSARTTSLENHLATSASLLTLVSQSSLSLGGILNGIEAVRYSHEDLEGKLAESVVRQSRAAMVLVGPQGSLEVGSRELGKERSGVRRFVESMKPLGEWWATWKMWWMGAGGDQEDDNRYISKKKID